MKHIAANAKYLFVCFFIVIAFIIRAQPAGTIDPSFNVGIGTNGSNIYAIAIQSDGKIIIGGDFNSFNGVYRSRIARLNSNGSLDSTFNNMGTGANSDVRAIAIQSDGKIIIGGDFFSYNGTTKHNVARLNTDGSIDSTFNVALGVIQEVRTISIQSDGKIIIGGMAASYNHIARLNTDGSKDNTFNIGSGFNLNVNCYVASTLIQNDGKIVVSGNFYSYNGVTTNSLARLNPNGSLDTSFNVGSLLVLYALSLSLQSDGKIVMGGTFYTQYSGVYKHRIARVNTDGSLDTTFNIGTGTGADDTVNTTAIQSDGKIIIGGQFDRFNGTNRSRLARLNTDGSLDLSFRFYVTHEAFAIAIQNDGKILVGGQLQNPNNSHGIARMYGDPKNVHGYVYNDINQNCFNENNEIGLPNRKLVISNGSNINYTAQTDNYGYWSIDSLPAGTYTAIFDTSGNWSTVCQTAISFTVIHPDSITQVSNYGLFSTQPCASPDISTHAPALRRCFSNQKVYVAACNKNIATGALNNAYVELQLDSLLIPQSATIPFTSLGNNTYRFDLDTLNPGMCADFYVTCSLSCAAVLNQTLCMNAKLFPADSCVFDTTSYFPEGVSRCNTQYDGSNLEVTAACYETDHIHFEIINTGDGDMTCYSPVRIFIDGQLIQFDSVMLASGDTAVFEFIGDGRTWRLETEQHPKHPGLFFPNATIEACGNIANRVPDMVNILPHDDADLIIDIYCGLVRSSYDPNDKTGYPLGVSSQRYIKPNQPIEYVIRFQNTGNDTAFTVVIRDTLSTDLDIFSVASGVSSHEYSFRMYGQRILEWTFDNILLPDSNVNEPVSNGFVVFTVNQSPDLPNNTLIENSASIFFDFNAPIITNTSQHTINDMLQTPLWTTQQSISEATCDSFWLNNIIYNESGIYYQRKSDTLIILNLTVNELPQPVIVLQNNMLLSSDTNFQTYQWLLNRQPFSNSDTLFISVQNTPNGNYSLQVIDTNGCIGVSNTINVLLESIGNTQQDHFNLTAYPNPFAQYTTIQYTLAHTANTSLKVYDVLGKQLMQTQNTNQPQGTHQIQFENTTDGKGIYIVELTVNGSKTIKRIVQVE